jgi:hypothetical protein
MNSANDAIEDYPLANEDDRIFCFIPGVQILEPNLA